MILCILMILGYGYVLGRELNPRNVFVPYEEIRERIFWKNANVQEIKSQRMHNERDHWGRPPEDFDKFIRRQMVCELIDHLDKSGAIFFTKRSYKDSPWNLQYGEVLYTAYLQLINDPEFYKYRVKYDEQLTGWNNYPI